MAKSGRKRKFSKTIRKDGLYPDQVEWLDREAKRKKCSRSAVIRDLIWTAMEDRGFRTARMD